MTKRVAVDAYEIERLAGRAKVCAKIDDAYDHTLERLHAIQCVRRMMEHRVTWDEQTLTDVQANEMRLLLQELGGRLDTLEGRQKYGIDLWNCWD